MVNLVIVGDTQRVLPVERLAFHHETNDTGRRRIAKAILAEPLDAIVHLGDVIGSASDWRRFDQDYPPDELSNQHIHVCRGNHDCGGLWFGSPEQFNRRFPSAIARLQEIDFGFLRLLLVDTNHRSQSAPQWSRQLSEFRSALAAASGDARVQHVLVAGHHPPFTNGRWHKPSQVVLRDFVEPFLECPKARAFLAGHVHGYEHFTIDRRTFVVTGGGGGARFSHLRGDRSRCPDVLDLTDPHPLHFISMQARPDTVSCTVRAIDEQSGDWFVLDQWSMP